MDNKSGVIKGFINTVFPGTAKSIEECKCPICRSSINIARDFRNTLSEKEYYISGMCQNCQDQMFGA